MRLLPNRIAIHVQERTPVAFVQIGSKISLIDAKGFVMGLPANRQVKYSFPVIQGITETEPLSSRTAAMKIYNRLVQDLDSEGAHYSNNLSEVDLADPEDVAVPQCDVGLVDAGVVEDDRVGDDCVRDGSPWTSPSRVTWPFWPATSCMSRMGPNGGNSFKTCNRWTCAMKGRSS